MDFTTQIVIFLAFTGVTVISNTVLIWFAYKAFATVTLKVTQTLAEFERSSATRQWLTSLQTASERAVTVTELTKVKMAEFDPAFATFHARFGFMLAKMDHRVERISADISDSAIRVRDAVARPAEKFAIVASGVQSALGFIAPSNVADDQE